MIHNNPDSISEWESEIVKDQYNSIMVSLHRKLVAAVDIEAYTGLAYCFVHTGAQMQD